MRSAYELRARTLGARLGIAVERVERVGGGYTPAMRALVRAVGGARFFLKASTDAETAAWLRTEIELYRALEGAPFIARAFGSIDAEGEVALLLEDLSGAHWPGAWRPGDIEAVRARLGELASWPIPTIELARCAPRSDALADWAQIARDPRAFLALGLCDARWLERALPAIEGALAGAPDSGEALLHADVRSDNLCVHPERGVIFVDWNWAARGPAAYDVAFWLPSLHREGGPAPSSFFEGEAWAPAAVAGFFCARASMPPIPTAPRVRPFQCAQARVALAWLGHALGIGLPTAA